MRLKDKIALVLGGTSGIELATVERLLAEGAHVIALGRRRGGQECALRMDGIIQCWGDSALFLSPD